MGERIVIDTNVLLSKPSIIFELPKAKIIIPQTVINEIDKIKTARVDRQIKYNGREVSRNLFKLTEKGNLKKGVSLKNGSSIKVLNVNHNREYPDGLNLKSPDDQIISVALYLKDNFSQDTITVLTSDLNMLLKAKGFGLSVRHYESSKKFKLINNIINVLSSKRRGLNSIAIVLVIILSIVAIIRFAQFSNQSPNNIIGAPPKIQSQYETFKIKENEYLKILDKNSKDLDALIGLGNLYYDNQQWQQSIDTYKQALDIDSDNNDVRTDMATAYHKLGINDIAIRELQRVIKNNPKHSLAYYNLGVIYFSGERSPKDAKEMFEKYLEVSPKGPFAKQAEEFIKQIDEN